jgi:hypothetical protein
VPQVAEALGDLRPDARGVALPRLLERRAHQEQRDDRARVGDGVEDERHGTAEREEHAAERRTGDPHDRPPGLLRPRRVGKLSRRDDGAQRAGLCSAEERRSRPLHERDDDDLPDRDATEEDRRRERRHRDRLNAVGGDHQPSPIPPVRRHPGEEPEEREGDDPGECDDACLRRRVRDGEHEQRVCEGRRLRAGGGQQLPGLQQHEVTVSSERGHSRPTVPGAAA